MKADKKYITQITTQDMKELAAVANLIAGEGIQVSKQEDCVVVSLDRDYVLRLIAMVVGG